MAAGAAAAAAGVPLPVFAFFGSSFSGSSGSSFWETEEGRQLIVFFGQTLISWGVPAAVALVFVLLAYTPDKVRVRLARALTLALTLALALALTLTPTLTLTLTLTLILTLTPTLTQTRVRTRRTAGCPPSSLR